MGKRNWAKATAAALAALLAACAAAPQDEAERFPTPEDYPPGVMERVAFTAGVPEGWQISTLRSAERPQARWRVVVVSGTPSWAAFWAPTIAALPEDMEMIVAERPGFSASQPEEAVESLDKQAAALAPLLDAPEGRRVILLGQSFGAPIAAIMAAQHPDKVDGMVLMSAFFGVRGPTANRLIAVGRVVRPILPQDMRNAIIEVTAQERQLPEAWAALQSLQIPLTFLHGGRDTFVPAAAAQGFAETYGAEYALVPEGDHFLQACCIPALIAALEGTIVRAGDRPARAEPLSAQAASQ